MKDATALILAFNKNLPAAAKTEKLKALQESPFRFYRGTCHLFYDRLTAIGKPKDRTRAWICGDLHIENFGSFKGDNRLVYFDLNDFDEAIMAPLSFEILRFTTAVLIAAPLFDYKPAQAKQLIKLALTQYRNTIMASKALMLERDVATGLMKDFFDRLAQNKRQQFIKGITETNGKKLRLKIDNIHSRPMAPAAHSQLMAWFKTEAAKTDMLKNMSVEDCAYRIAGTGSLGCERYMLLVKNKETSKYYLLDMKEAKPSSLKKHVDIKQPNWQHQAERVIAIQTRLQFCQPALLMPLFYNNKWFVLRELQPVQNKISLTDAKGKLTKLEDIILPMAQLAAYAHLRGTGRQGASTADELAAALLRPKWINRRFELAQQLATQTLKDYKQFLDYKIDSK